MAAQCELTSEAREEDRKELQQLTQSPVQTRTP